MKGLHEITPHVLATPVHTEVPKQYGNTNENEDLLFVAVSYYLDEDEFEELFHYKRFESTDPGQENEAPRGGYVAKAIMASVLGDYGGRWTGQTHLDSEITPRWKCHLGREFAYTLRYHNSNELKLVLCVSPVRP